MYIKNPEVLGKTYRARGIVGSYFIQNRVYPLGGNEEWLYFLYNNELKTLIDKMPFWLKIINKGGVIGGG